MTIDSESPAILARETGRTLDKHGDFEAYHGFVHDLFQEG